MFQTQAVWAKVALVGVITDGGSSLAFLTPSLVGVFSIMRSSDQQWGPHTGPGRGGEKIGAGPSPNTNCQTRDKLFYGRIIQIMSGPSVLLRANWNTDCRA